MKYRTVIATSAVLLMSAYVSAKMTERSAHPAPKAPSLIGVWKSECQADAVDSSVMSQVTYSATGQVVSEDFLYPSADCTGTPVAGAKETMSFQIMGETETTMQLRFYNDPANVGVKATVDAMMEVVFTSPSAAKFKLVGATFKTESGTVEAYPPSAFGQTPVVSFVKN
jgi:hypothetical protein